MKLILNADDFGLTESVNLGIADCFRAGTVKSTTIMMNQPGV
ncbi:ChbG/HpnK family deacetylase, partial [Vibrio alginolyticus]